MFTGTGVISFFEQVKSPSKRVVVDGEHRFHRLLVAVPQHVVR